jgi:folate-binding protein YgfZ
MAGSFQTQRTRSVMVASSVDPANRQRDYDAIKSGAGLVFLDNRLVVRVSGDDRISFLHGMCTADVKSLAPGKLARALFLTEHAHVIADCFIYALEEHALWLEVEQPRWAAIREHLERFLVADDVELEELDMVGMLDVEGPASIDVVAESVGDAARKLGQWQHLKCDGFRVANLPRYGGPAFTLIAERAALASLAERTKQLRPEIRELNAQTLEAVRVENGLALIGRDTDERTLALEARLEPAIAFDKGCYVGQETIERATARGSLKRRLYGLRIAGNEMPSPGALVQLGSKQVGRLTSVAPSPAAGIIGLAILHHSAWAMGTRVSVIGDKGTISGFVCELPFGQCGPGATSEA